MEVDGQMPRERIAIVDAGEVIKRDPLSKSGATDLAPAGGALVDDGAAPSPIDQATRHAAGKLDAEELATAPRPQGWPTHGAPSRPAAAQPSRIGTTPPWPTTHYGSR